MKKAEEIKYNENIKLKIKTEREKKEQKMLSDYKMFNDKINMIFNEMKSNRNIDYDKMIHKHKCILKELEATQKLELSNLDKITKGISSKTQII